MVSGGGKDRKVVLWGHDYSKKEEMEVMTGQEEMEEKEENKNISCEAQTDSCRNSAPWWSLRPGGRVFRPSSCSG